MMDQAKTWDAGIYNEGNGKYQCDYDRLVDLIPKRGRSDTVAGEIMRAVRKLNNYFYGVGRLNETSSDAISFLAMTVGVFYENDGSLPTIIHCVKGKIENNNRAELQVAIEQMIDCSIEYILQHPDLEYAENTIDMSRLYKECRIDLMERLLTTHAVAAAKASHNDQKPLQEMISTPIAANRRVCSVAESLS